MPTTTERILRPEELIWDELFEETTVSYNEYAEQYTFTLHGDTLIVNVSPNDPREPHEIKEWAVRELVNRSPLPAQPPTFTLPGLQLENVRPDVEEIEQHILQVDVEEIEQRILQREVESTRPTPTAAPFHLQLNTQALEMRELRDKYPEDIFVRNLQVSVLVALEDERINIKSYLFSLKRLKAAREVMRNAQGSRYAKKITDLMYATFSTTDLLTIQTDIEDTSAYRRSVRAIENYRSQVAQFKNSKRNYAHLQAQYSQRADLIRQKPSIPIEIDVQNFIDTVSQWDIVWGVAI
jgi:hypothetical protein